MLSQICEECGTDVELFWLYCYGSGTEKMRLRTLTTAQYLRGMGNNPYALRRAEALKWIYQNCRRKYQIIWTKPLRTKKPNSFDRNVRAFHCEFKNVNDAILFKLIFNDFLQEANSHESGNLL